MGIGTFPLDTTQPIVSPIRIAVPEAIRSVIDERTATVMKVYTPIGAEDRVFHS